MGKGLFSLLVSTRAGSSFVSLPGMYLRAAALAVLRGHGDLALASETRSSSSTPGSTTSPSQHFLPKCLES